jgi:cyclopropane-fatty-acyl-phospholipid synthase
MTLRDNREGFPAGASAQSAHRPRLRRGLWAALLAGIGGRLQTGKLTIETPSGEHLVFGGKAPGPAASLQIHRWRSLRRLILGGDLGFAESYMDGDWSSPDLAALIEFAVRNEAALGSAIMGTAPLRLLNRLRHLARANTRRGSRRNIAQHYDLGNAFYQRWLDPSMTYSSAYYAGDAGVRTLEEAQAAKIDRAIGQLGLAGGERVLEIGCGWGALAETLASRYDSHVTGLTLSKEQRAYAEARLSKAGLSDRAEICLRDYRDEKGLFDRIISIEMFEAVGEANWPKFFEVVRERLGRGGTAVLQIITIADERFETYRRAADFIQRYIFPGGMLPSPSVLREQIARAGLSLASLENFGASYAKTLAEWNRRFQRAWADIAALGFDARFKRMWEYYLAYCEAGFRAGIIDVGLYRIEKPLSNRN